MGPRTNVDVMDETGCSARIRANRTGPEVTMKFPASLLNLLFATNAAVALEAYYRSPSLRGDLIVFTAEGDLAASPR